MKTLVIEALQGLRRRRAATFAATTGLALALAACVLVAMLAIALSQPDPAIPEPARTVLLDTKRNVPGGEWTKRAPLAFATLLKERGVTRIGRAVQDGLDVRYDGRLQPILPYFVDPDVPAMLGIEALSGDIRSTLSRRDGIVITMDAMHRLWGEVRPHDVIGRHIEARGSARPKDFQWFTVGAVVSNIDRRNPLGFRSPLIGASAAFLGYESQAALPTFADPSLGDVGWLFVTLPPDSSPRQIGEWMRDVFKSSSLNAQLPPELAALREPILFRAVTLQDEPLGLTTRWQIVAALGGVSALLLVLAVLNCMNLQTATLLQRRRETALRLSVGADATRLLCLWGMEVALGLLLAALAALLIAWWLAPAMAQWLDLAPEYAIGKSIPMTVLLGLALVIIVLAPVTLALPAWRALRRAPAPALQGRTPSEGPWGRRLRQWLLAFQLLGALALLSMAGIIAAQQRHVLSAERGLDTRNRLCLSVLVNPENVPNMDAFISALERHPAVKHWAFGYVPGTEDGATTEYESGAHRKGSLRVNTVSAGFFATYGMKILAGRPQVGSGETNLVLDAKAARLLGFATPQAAVGELLRMTDERSETRRIVAVIDDVKMESARRAALPQSFVLSDRTQWDVSVHVDDAVTGRRVVENLFETHGPALVYLVQAADEVLADVYAQERKLAQMLGACSLLAIFVAMLGAYALVSDTLRRRRTELILHRLHGANDVAIVKQFAIELAVPLAVAVTIAVPLVAGMGRMYLDNFVERVGIGAGIALPLAATVIAVAAVVTLSALRHFRLAMALQPMDALK